MNYSLVFSLFFILPNQLQAFENEGLEQIPTFSFMSYNVENLFDTVDDPNRDDQEFTPGGSAKWTELKLAQKMSNLAEVITSIKNPNGKLCPDFLGLVEVENAQILKRFNREYLKKCEYSKIVIDPKDPDPRGIRVASLTRLPIVGTPKSHSAYTDARFIQEVTVKLSGVPMTVFINHWKSRRKDPKTNDDGSLKRALSAKTLRKRVLEITETNPDAEVLMLGDFNDEPENDSIRNELGSTLFLQKFMDAAPEIIAWNPAHELIRLANTDENSSELARLNELKKIRSTYYFARENKYHLFDNAHMTAGLLDNQGIQYLPQSFRVVRLKDFTNEKLAPIPFNPVRGNGASDHFPIVLRFAVLDPL